ncbi:uncharacterized protein [Glycine max]|uniref:uncharacterized protein n=1 Tax=Glycine max TaxID=3847 RepID=UPI0003DE7DE7|nr:uncharacterized protein LOC102668360 [Glycine max]|eukprot:XP_006606862.1 uncharacterized protein LOC102668360 [Glycine max]
MELQEIKSYGSRFTWCRPNGSVRSRLDRCLVSEQWLIKWPDSSQQVLHRDYSDHCPILLKTDMVDWGPKPFRVMDCWLKNKQYQALVKDVWCGDQQPGWGSIVLKNKLKNLKSNIKKWSIEFGDITRHKIQHLKQQLHQIDISAQDRTLGDDEVKTMKSIQQKLWEVSFAHESILRQKSRIRWLREGDNNTTFFHKSINFRRHYNAIQGMFIEGTWVQNPKLIKDQAVSFFTARFTEENYDRPTLDGVQFNTITHTQREEMIAPFSDLELREAVWSCSGDKCPGPDGFNFNFIKEF